MLGHSMGTLRLYEILHKMQKHLGSLGPEEVGHCMLPYIKDQILELVNETLLVAVL